MELKIDGLSRGTRIIFGVEAKQRDMLLRSMIDHVEKNAFIPIVLPSIEPQTTYIEKAGSEVLDQMYIFDDKKGRQLCLRPEATATIQAIAEKYWKYQEVRVWYFEKCWRYERPQRGRYREFWQFGCEVLNPQRDMKKELIELAVGLCGLRTKDLTISDSVKRGLDYYTGNGFEISCGQLGAQRQICGGGEYKNGIGFAIGFDRLMLCE